MGSRLTAKFGLANGETLWIIAQDTLTEGNNDQVLENYKTRMLEQAQLPPEAVQTTEVLRGYVFGAMPNGTRIYIDLYVPTPAS